MRLGNARLNSAEASKRADNLLARLQKCMEELVLERQISALPPVLLGGLLVVPMGLLAKLSGKPLPEPSRPVDTQAAAARAREIVMGVERELGFEPVDREFERLGYDIESRLPGSGRLRFIEVKGRVSSALSPPALPEGAGCVGGECELYLCGITEPGGATRLISYDEKINVYLYVNTMVEYQSNALNYTLL